MPRLVTWLFGLFLLLLVSRAPAQELVTRSYTLEDGLPAAQVFTAYQDTRGYIWLGTPAGLARYDGHTMRVFNVADGLTHDSVRAIAEYDGALWFAGEKGATRYRAGTFSTALALEQGLPAGIVWRMAVFDGALWFGTSKGLARYDGRAVKTFGVADGLPHESVFALLSDGDQLWIGTRGGGLCRYDGSHFERIGAKAGLDAQHVMALAKTGDTLWVGTRDGGVYRQDGKRFVKQLADLNVYSVAVRGEEVFWGTLGQGVVRMYPDGHTVRYDTRNALVGDRVYSVLIDRESTPWITTNAGVSKLLSDRFLGYLPGINVLSVARFRQSMLFGTLGKGVYRLRDGKLDNLSVEQGLAHNTVWGLAVDGDRVWVGTSDGISEYDGEKLIAHPIAAEGETPVYDIVPDGEFLWIAGPNGVCRYRPSNGGGKSSCDRHGSAQGLPNAVAYSGTRWGNAVCFATEAGVGCSENGKVRIYGVADGLPSATVYAIEGDAKGTLWVGTNLGVARLEGEHFVSVGQDTAVGRNFISAITEMQPGTLAVASNRKLLLFDGQKVLRELDRHSGLIGYEPNFDAMARGAEDTLWIGTSTGISRYFPKLDIANAVPPLVEVTSWEANAIAHNGSGVKLDSTHNDVSFEYAGLSYRDESDVRFRYQLVGYDKQWSAPRRGRNVRYTNLAPGDYRFVLEAENGDGVWSVAPAVVSFSVQAPYWMTWWFRGLIGLLALGAFYAVYRLRIGAVRRANEELESIVQERTQQLTLANDELKELTLTDPLTRLRNRRFLREMMVFETARSKRLLHAQGQPEDGPSEGGSLGNIGFLLIDVDHFKEVNDSHGHDAGDVLLRAIAAAISGAVREVDSVVRWGGEEFLVVCRDTERSALRQLAQRVASRVSELSVDVDGEPLSRSCSIGYSLYPFNRNAPEWFNYEEVIGFADKALYLAKTDGRNRVVGIVGSERSAGDEDKLRVKVDIGYAVSAGFATVVGSSSYPRPGPESS